MADLTSFTFQEESKSLSLSFRASVERCQNVCGFGRITKESTTCTNDVCTSAAIDHNVQREEQPFKRGWWAEPMLKGWRVAVM